MYPEGRYPETLLCSYEDPPHQDQISSRSSLVYRRHVVSSSTLDFVCSRSWYDVRDLSPFKFGFLINWSNWTAENILKTCIPVENLRASAGTRRKDFLVWRGFGA